MSADFCTGLQQIASYTYVNSL